MDMNDKDNLLIQSFFDSHRQPSIPDNGFSERVMRHIPRHRLSRTVILSRRWTVLCTCVAIVLFVALGGADIMKADVGRLLSGLAAYLLSIAIHPGAVALMYLGFLVLTAFGIYDISTAEYRFLKGKKETVEHAQS